MIRSKTFIGLLKACFVQQVGCYFLDFIVLSTAEDHVMTTIHKSWRTRDEEAGTFCGASVPGFHSHTR